MARTNTSTTTASRRKPSLDATLQDLLSRARAVVRGEPPYEVAAIERLSVEIEEAKGLIEAQIQVLDDEYDDALLDSEESSTENRAARAALVVTMQALAEPLARGVAKRLKQSAGQNLLHALESRLKRARALVAEAQKLAPEYERHAKAIAEMLPTFRRAWEEYVNAERDLTDAGDRERITLAERDALRKALPFKTSELARITVAGRGCIADHVQLPSIGELNPHWGNVHGRLPDEPRAVDTEVARSGSAERRRRLVQAERPMVHSDDAEVDFADDDAARSD